MKKKKKIMILLFMSFFVSGIIFTVESSRDLNLNIDISNAIQKIWSIILYTGWDEWTELWILTSDENDKLKITWSWDNFIINYRNDITDSEYSSILWWTGNEIHGWKYSTVYGWVWNDIQSDYSVILWWRDNTVHSNSTGSVIVWNNNKVNSLSRSLENSVVVWNNNEMNGSYSSVVWYNSTVGIGENGETYNSVAMWSWAMVIWNNSFLRVDGSETVDLYNDEVFVVFWEKGMAVNESAPNDKAKFNVWSRFILDMWNTRGEENGNLSDSMVCGSGNGTWIVKIEDRDDIEGQKCLCNCDGQWWKSMIWDGQCEAICKGEKSDVFPECVTWWIELIQLWDGKMDYSWGCIWWSAIKTSFFMPWDTMWWQCQWKNGNTTRCSYKSECTWNIPWLEDGAVEINNNLVPPIWSNKNTYKYSTDKSEVCTYSCKAWYALDGIHRCSKVCNESSKSCNLWSIKYLNNPTYTNDYKYGCLYDNELFECEANCDDGKIWNGDHCIDSTNVCGTTRYQCFIWRVSNTWTDSQNFIWDCVDERENIIESCHIAKQVVDRVVYYNYIRDWNGQNVSFYMTGDDIPVDIKIKQTYTYNNGSMTDVKIYIIKAHDKVSDNGLFNQWIILWDKWWYTGTNDYTVKNDELFVMDTDKVYRLRIEDYNGLCANNCSTAWQCLRWWLRNSYDFFGKITWEANNEYMFTWSCKLWSRTENCEARCSLDAWKCGSVWTIANSVNCDPSSDSECNIWWTWNILSTNFYMDNSEEKIVWSKCGIKRHCVFSNTEYGVKCTESIENCQQKWFKCKNNYVLSGCSCVPKSSICLSNTNPWSCANWMTATWYSKWEWKTTYSYYCQKEGMERVWCEASCSNGKIWNGTSCIVVPEMCGEKHNNCINQSVLKSNQKDDYAKKYKRTCGLWSNTKECSECYSWYIILS